MTYTIWKASGEQVAGGMQMNEQFPPDVPSHWMMYFAVDDLEARTEKVRELGGAVTVPPSDIPDMGRFAVLGDPQGAVFAFFKPGS
jgi:uncharacterized protein